MHGTDTIAANKQEAEHQRNTDTLPTPPTCPCCLLFNGP
jgi:hypothetical protein